MAIRARTRRHRASRDHHPAFFRRLAIQQLEERALLALTPQLLADINTEPLGVQEAGSIVEMGGFGYFQGNDGIHGPELWRSDGTAAGTSLVKEINSGADGSNAFYP